LVEGEDACVDLRIVQSMHLLRREAEGKLRFKAHRNQIAGGWREDGNGKLRTLRFSRCSHTMVCVDAKIG
jgi:hypothetical protein